MRERRPSRELPSTPVCRGDVAFVDGESEVHRYGRACDLLTAMALDPMRRSG